ncbi:MAG: MATE family efflux transporter [[Clostridium] nexile]
MTNSIAQKFNVFSLLKFAFPTMVMMVFMSLYTIVDGIFVSRLVGSNALSAVNIVYPVINLMFGAGLCYQQVGAPLSHVRLARKKSEARENFSLIAFLSFW